MCGAKETTEMFVNTNWDMHLVKFPYVSVYRVENR